MNYAFANLLGAPYRGGNLLLHGTELLSPVGNRVSQINLAHSTSQTLPFENLKQIRTLCLSPDGSLLLSVDSEGKALVVHRGRRVLLHHVSFKAPVRAARFSPDGKMIAVAVGKLLQVWNTPSTAKSMAPMQLHRTYGGAHDDITSVDWSPCGQFVAVASKDLTARVFSLNPIPGYAPATLAGHKDGLVAVFWTSEATQAAAALAGQPPSHLYTLSRDGALFGWTFQKPTAASEGAPGGGAGGGSGSGSGSDSGSDDEGGGGGAGAAAAPAFAGGAWRVAFKHYFMQRGAKLSCADLHRRVKLFQLSSGFCYVTFTEHTAPVTAVRFLPSGHAVLSASLDGTVRAHDLVRYRNFRTLTTPAPQQFLSLAVDPGGEIACAGTLDSFQICVWSIKTGRLLDVLAGHEGPVCGLAFSPSQPVLASCSWDGSVKLWDVYDGAGCVETLQHAHDVLALAYMPDGRQLAAATLDGSIYLWDAQEGELQGTIDGRRDVRGGAITGDRRSASNAAAGAAFTSLAYSADGAQLFAAGNSKFVCVYDVAERLMLRKFQVTHNRSLDGVLDQASTRGLTDAGPLELIDADGADDADELLPPTGGAGAGSDAGLAIGAAGAAKRRPAARVRALALSPTGQGWAAATTEGVLMYALDSGAAFDPTDL
ncbi:hypothetical protein Rsub_05817 [Raphidocelis subcapitata]|uniref:Uncharacterized protein n=1 Tax=Raphidocelis subcapitata TaxID=307507 RepID=A0A2V0NZB6_9CHLO|nr:hypothetical protein Rsub_05817 [Raphidocelis subcapitata]|eukprot:GBF92981.1 hypothetical protein Rsub_05817 [Raphidocelis subcapitata]